MNYIICMVLAMGVVLEVIYILKSNRQILVKGRCDLFISICIVGGVQLLFPVMEHVSKIIMTRNILLMVMALLFLGVRNGFTNAGAAKNGFTMKWDQMEKVVLKETELSWVAVTCEGKSRRFTILVKKSCLEQLCIMFRQHTSIEGLPITG